MVAATTRMSTFSGLAVADADDDPLLQRAQELHLEVERQLADLVEEERPLVGDLELARPRRDGAGERPLHVAEQLALDEVLGDGAAVDDDERRRGAVRASVNLAGDELLARAGLAGDEHADVGRRDLL